jgi:TPR repeat protein
VGAIDHLTRDEIAQRLSGNERAALIRDGAEAGVAEAQLVWGQMLLDGAGVRQDRAAAFAWFNRAAAQRHVMALNMVGRCYDLGWGVGVDKARAAACFRSAAEAGLVEAMYNYATALALGAGVVEDRAGALGWFRRAAELGYAKAMNHLGSFHEDGWATPRDMGEAARWYARAAEGGDFRGAFNHARMLIEGGERADALAWIERAGAWGNAGFRDKARAWLRASVLGQDGVAALDRGAAAC